MKIPILVGPEKLDVFVADCAKALFSMEPYHFIYLDNCSSVPWSENEIKDANKDFLGSLRGRANVYAIFVRDHGSRSPWKKMYVGERKSKGLRDRITQHLIKKDHRTGSVLEKIKAVVSLKQEVGISLIKVEPESLRLFVEEKIIEEYKSDLPWNKHG